MPTPLSRPVTRKIVTLRGAALIVTLAPEGIRFREPRRRRSYVIPYGIAFLEAVEIHVAAERRRKALDRKARKIAKRGGR